MDYKIRTRNKQEFEKAKDAMREKAEEEELNNGI